MYVHAHAHAHAIVDKYSRYVQNIDNLCSAQVFFLQLYLRHRRPSLSPVPCALDTLLDFAVIKTD